MNPDEVRFRLLRGDDVPATNPLNLAYRFGLRDTKQEIVAGERQPNGTLVLDFSLKLKEGKDQSTLSLQAALSVVLSMIVSFIYPGGRLSGATTSTRSRSALRLSIDADYSSD